MSHIVCIWHVTAILFHQHWPGTGFYFMSRLLQKSDVFIVACTWRRCCPHVTNQMDWSSRKVAAAGPHALRWSFFYPGIVLEWSTLMSGTKEWMEGGRDGGGGGQLEGGDTKMNGYLGSLKGPKQTPAQRPSAPDLKSEVPSVFNKILVKRKRDRK